jgi:hypothetical protein
MHELNVRITAKAPLDLVMGALALVTVLRDWHAAKFEGSPRWATLGNEYEVRVEYTARLDRGRGQD